MIRRLALTALLALLPGLAAAQMAFIAPTPSNPADISNRIATTAWLNTWSPPGNFVIVGNLTVGGVIIDGQGQLLTNMVAPATPAAGTTRVYVDSTQKVLSAKNDAGTVSNTVVPSVAVATQFMTGISAAGVITRAQPNFTDLAGQGTCAQEPALTGGVTSPAGSCVTTVITNANLTGPVTSVGNATTIGANQVSRANEAQGVARSIVGVTGNATANVADIQGTANQALVINSAGTALAFGQINMAAAAAVTGTLPIANGGTNDTGTAWSTYTPTITAQAGTPTTVTAAGRFKTIGKTVFFQLTVTITAIGTATGLLNATLPVTAVTGPIQVASGVESAITGKLCKSFISSGSTTVALSFYDNTSVWANSNVVTAEGVYESN